MATLLLAIHVIICIFLILIVLMQTSQEGGLSGLFTGGAGQPLFGSRTGNILTRITTILAICFMLTSLSLTIISVRRPRRVIDKILTEEKTEVPNTTTLPIAPVTPASEETMPSGDLP